MKPFKVARFIRKLVAAAFPQYWNPADASTEVILSNSNRSATRAASSGAWRSARSVRSHTAGKWYFEWQATSNNNGGMIGLADSALAVANQYPGQTANSFGYYYNSTQGEAYNNANAYLSGSGTVGDGSYARVAVDFNSGKIWFGNAAAWKNSGDPAAGTGETFTFTPKTERFMAIGLFSNGNAGTLRTIASQMEGVVPTGFTPWEAATSALYDRIMSLAPFAYCRNGEAGGTVMKNEAGPDGGYSPRIQLGNSPLYPGGPTSVGGNFSNSVVGAITAPNTLPAMTLLTVARPTDLTGTHVLGFTKDNGFSDRKYQWRSNGTSLEFVKIIGGVQTVSAPSVMTADETQLLAYEVDAAGKYSLYRNGLPVKMGTIGATDYSDGGQMHLGFSNGASANFVGTTSDNAVFDKALGPAAHAAMFAALSGLDTYFRRWATQGMANTDSYGTFDGTSYNRVVDGKLRLNSAARMTAARVRLNDVPDMTDFEAVFSVTIPTDDAFGVPNAGLIYRTYYWSNDNDTFGYVMSIRSAGVQFGHGSMSSTPGYSDIVQVSRPMDPGTTHTVRVRVEGSRHRVWIDGDAAPVLDNTNTWSLDPGGFGLNSYVGSSGQTFIDVGDINIRPLS